VVNELDIEGGKENVFFRAPFFEMSVFAHGDKGAVPSLDSKDPKSMYVTPKEEQAVRWTRAQRDWHFNIGSESGSGFGQIFEIGSGSVRDRD
jgi:hypothetical protein